MSDGGTPTPTPRYRQVLDDSARVAREMGHSYVGVEHLFLAIIRNRGAVPTQVLARITDLEHVDTSICEEMDTDAYRGKPPEDAAWLPVSELRAVLSALPSAVDPGVTWGFNVVGDRAWILLDQPGNTSVAVASARAQINRE